MKVIIKRPVRPGGVAQFHEAGPLPTDPALSEPPPDAGDRPFRLVLVVEDDPALRRVVASNLTGRGLEVRQADTATAALAAIAAERPDLILLDINLPDRSGWDVMREMNRIGTCVPTIVVSAVRVSQSRLDEFRPLAYLPKPFPIEALLRLVFRIPLPEADTAADEG